ncbi:MAG TPA: DUF4446 family protein [Candidatus Portnoybacteria bacterium]|nr:DUF4446 family protein [Candidatus Portnoybacteria bacterium]
MLAAISTTLTLNPLLALIILVALIFLAWNLTLHWQVYQTGKKIKLMFKGTKVADLEGVIFEQIKRLRQTEKNLAELEKFCRQMDKMAQSSLQKIGVIRFNPFSDTGGDQSFCIACLDAKDNGFTLTSLFTREGTRIYTKPITAGESKYQLTEEEKRAIGEATSAKSTGKIKKQK